MRYFITFLIGIGLVILIIILLIRAIFGGGGTPEPKADLAADYANSNVVMRLTIDGPVNAEPIHNQIRIDVSQYSSELRIIEGYEGRVSRTERFDSNSTAYANFLRAIDLLGYTEGNDDEKVRDERGYCPFGQRYIFEIIDGTDSIQRYWATSCDDRISFKGNYEDIIELFRNQIPEYREVTRDISVD